MARGARNNKNDDNISGSGTTKRAVGWVASLAQPGWAETLRRCTEVIARADAQGAEAPERVWLARVAWQEHGEVAGALGAATPAPALIYAAKSNRRPPALARFLRDEPRRLFRTAIIEPKTLHLTDETSATPRHSYPILGVVRLPSLWAALNLLDEDETDSPGALQQPSSGRDTEWLALPAAAAPHALAEQAAARNQQAAAAHETLEALKVTLVRHHARWREPLVRTLERVSLRLSDGGHAQALRFQASPHELPLLITGVHRHSRLAALPAEVRATNARQQQPDGQGDVWLFRRVRGGDEAGAYSARGGADAFVPWGLTLSPLALERTDTLPAGIPLWQPWKHNPLAVLEPTSLDTTTATATSTTKAAVSAGPPPHQRDTPEAVTSQPTVPVVELATQTARVPLWEPDPVDGANSETARRTKGVAAGSPRQSTAEPPSRIPVEFRLVHDDAAAASSRGEAGAWLLDADAYSRFAEVLRVQPERALDGLLLAAIPELERWLLLRSEREHGVAYDFPGQGFAALPGCANAYMPLGFSLRPRINPSRLGDYVALPADGSLALFVPCTPAAAHSTTKTSAALGSPFEVLRLRRDAFVPLRDALTYTHALALSRKLPVEPQRLLDESLHVTARTYATAFHRGLLALKRTSQEAERPAIPVSASGLSHDTEQIPAAPFREVLHKEPDSESSPALEPLIVESPLPQATDEVRQREIELEEAIARQLLVPANPELAPLWLELAGLKATRGRLDEALYAWASAAWLHKRGENETASTLTEQALATSLERLAVATDRAAHFRRLPSPKLLDALAAQDSWRAEHSVWLLYLLERLAHAGGADASMLVKVQQLLGQVRSTLPYKVRWLLVSRLATLVGDDVALEREREDLLGELNLRGISRGNLLPLIRRLLRRSRPSARTAPPDQSPPGEPEHPTHVTLEVEAGPAGERATMDWPAAALEKWVRVLQRITAMIRHTGHGEAPVLMPYAEMLLTVSREAGKQLPLSQLRSHVEQSRAQMLKGVLREHLADFDAEHQQPNEKQRREALHQFAQSTAASDSQASAAPPDTFTELPAELRERISTYLVLVSLRWAQPAVREFWTLYLRAQSLSTILTVIAASHAAPLRWLTVLGQDFLFEQLLPKIEAALTGYKQPSESEKVQLILVLDELARIFERRDLPGYLRHDAALSASRAEEGRRRVEELFERVCKKVRWLKDKAAADRYAGVLKRLGTLDAEALSQLGAEANPQSEKDTQWLDVTARMKLARAHHLCALARRHEALELIQAVHNAIRTTYTQQHKKKQQQRAPLTSHVRNSLGWLLEDLLATLPLTGNRTLGVKIVEECVREARAINDARYSAHVLSTAARTLAQLGAHDATETQLSSILATAREQLSTAPSYLFEVVERVVSAGIELLPAARLEDQILTTLRQWLQSEVAFDGNDGTFYRVKTAILIRFAEWSLSPSERVIPALHDLLTDSVREELLGDDPLDLAVYWAEWFLKVHAYEWEESIMTYFQTIDELVQQQQDNRPQAGHGAALQYLRKLTDHFIGNVAVEDRSIREFCRREESLIRDRVTGRREWLVGSG